MGYCDAIEDGIETVGGKFGYYYRIPCEICGEKIRRTQYSRKNKERHFKNRYYNKKVARIINSSHKSFLKSVNRKRCDGNKLLCRF